MFLVWVDRKMLGYSELGVIRETLNLTSVAMELPTVAIILKRCPPTPPRAKVLVGVTRCSWAVLREISLQPEELGPFPGRSSELFTSS